MNYQTPVRRTVWYSGKVQGVGFRATAQNVARRFDVRGCVRNLANGEVELIVEGGEATVERFLTALAVRMAEYIERTRMESGPAAGEWTDFAVRP